MIAIQQFAQKYGKVTGKELDRNYDGISAEFRKAVKSILDKGGEFNIDDAVNEGTNKDFNIWQVILTGVDERLLPMTHRLVLVLKTDLKNGNSWLECHYYDDDTNLLSKVEGKVGEFNPIPVIADCISQYWDKKRSGKKKLNPVKRSHRFNGDLKHINTFEKEFLQWIRHTHPNLSVIPTTPPLQPSPRPCSSRTRTTRMNS